MHTRRTDGNTAHAFSTSFGRLAAAVELSTWCERPWTRVGEALYGTVYMVKPGIIAMGRILGYAIRKPWHFGFDMRFISNAVVIWTQKTSMHLYGHRSHWLKHFDLLVLCDDAINTSTERLIGAKNSAIDESKAPFHHALWPIDRWALLSKPYQWHISRPQGLKTYLKGTVTAGQLSSFGKLGHAVLFPPYGLWRTTESGFKMVTCAVRQPDQCTQLVTSLKTARNKSNFPTGSLWLPVLFSFLTHLPGYLI